MREVFVLGVGQSKFGKFKDRTAVELGTEAASLAIKDAGIDPRLIQVAYGSRVVDSSTNVQDILKNIGVTNIEMNNIENACASGISAANLLWRDISNDVYDVGIVVGTEAMTTSSIAGKLLSSNKDDINGQIGMSMPGFFALMTRRLMEETGATAEDLAYPSYKNHRNACLNPYSMYQKNLTIEEIVNSRIISDPITLLECCPSTDGAAALILCSEDFARKYTTKLIRIAASKITSGTFENMDHGITNFPVVKELAGKCYEMAGISPEELDCVELHDAFSPEEIWAYSDLGLCRPEDAITFMRAGNANIDGKCAVNASGGLLSLGHPLGASGVRVICEITLQLRGDAGAHQRRDAKVGLAQMIGGFISGLQPPISAGIQILKR